MSPPQQGIRWELQQEGKLIPWSCHIMINYELPWNPNRLEQRIGRLHRYGQDREVKVWNFQLEGTREAEIFSRLATKLEEIREKLGSTADVLGLLDDIDIESFVMESVQNREPPSASGEQLELMLEDRERTLREWLDRSPIDSSTFDAESRQRIMEIVDESQEVLDTSDVRGFCLDAVQLLGGDVRENRDGTYSLSLPDAVADEVGGKRVDRVTFDRETALERDDTVFVAADSEILTATLERALQETDEDRGQVGVKILPFLDEPGIVFVSTLGFEDGTGELIREEFVPVFVGAETREGREEVGRKVVNGTSLDVDLSAGRVRELLTLKSELEEVADAYLARTLDRIQRGLADERDEETERELQDLRKYEREERERLEAFIEKYEKRAEEGAEDMSIAIRRQESRLRELESRAKERRKNIGQKGRVIALAPERVNICMAIPG